MFFLWLPMYWAYLNLNVWVIWASVIFPKILREFLVYLFVGEPYFYVWICVGHLLLRSCRVPLL